METANVILGIIASITSITATFISIRASNRSKKIEKILKQNLNIDDSTKYIGKRKSKSGKNGTSIIGDNNNVIGGMK